MKTNVQLIESTISSLRDKCSKSSRQERCYVNLTDGKQQTQILVMVSPRGNGYVVGFRRWGTRVSKDSVMGTAYQYDDNRRANSVTTPLTWGEFRQYRVELYELMDLKSPTGEQLTKLWHIADRLTYEVMRETMTAVLDKWAHHSYRPTLSMDDPLQKMMADAYDYLAKRRGLRVEAYRIKAA